MYPLLLLFCVFVGYSHALYGGHEIEIESAPHQVSVWEREHHSCGGSIVSTEWILTLGRCVDAFVENFKVHAGSKHAEGGSVHEVVEAVHHPYGSSGNPSRELALLRVSPPLTLDDTRQPVKLVDVDYKLLPNERLHLSGYGYTDGFLPAPALRSSTAISMLLEVCVKAYGDRFGSISPGLACSDGRDGKTSGCSGDSGNPVVLEDGRQVAVATSRHSCGKDQEEPDVHALVAKARGWIKIVAGV